MESCCLLNGNVLEKYLKYSDWINVSLGTFSVFVDLTYNHTLTLFPIRHAELIVVNSWSKLTIKRVFACRVSFPTLELVKVGKDDGATDFQYKGLRRRSIPLPFPPPGNLSNQNQDRFTYMVDYIYFLTQGNKVLIYELSTTLQLF